MIIIVCQVLRLEHVLSAVEYKSESEKFWCDEKEIRTIIVTRVSERGTGVANGGKVGHHFCRLPEINHPSPRQDHYQVKQLKDVGPATRS